MNKQITKIKSNPMGAVLGGVAAYLGARKLGIKNQWASLGLGAAGIFAGAMISSAMKAKASAPKASTK